MTTPSMPRRAAAALLTLAAVLAPPLAAQETHLSGFTDVTFRASDEPGDNSAFGLGQFVGHVRSRLGGNWSFLAETVFEWDVTDFAVDVERVIITYSASDQFQASAGKQHSPFGIWNNKYHHGTLFQPTIERPLLVQFEDDGGILPVHTMGIRASGHELTRAHLGYDVMVGNGIGSTPVSDNNPSKIVMASLFTEPTSALRVGVSGYLDQLAAGTPTLAGSLLAGDTRQTMIGASAAYERGNVHLHGELTDITNDLAGTSTSTLGYFIYGGYRIRQWVPYALWEQINYPATDPYFAVDDYRQGILGLRRDLAARVVVKLEYRNRHLASVGTINEGAAQIAVGF
jgi:hypothetical protein